jgi:hypothetical protein
MYVLDCIGPGSSGSSGTTSDTHSATGEDKIKHRTGPDRKYSTVSGGGGGAGGPIRLSRLTHA